MNLLLAFPRTGSTWTRYIVEFFSEGVCDGYYDNKSVLSTIKDNNIDTLYEIKNQNVFMTMIHHHHEIRNSPTKLIVTQRNPVELLPSFYYSRNHKNKKIPIKNFMKTLTFSKLKNICRSYKENLNFYKRFKGEKIILNYEFLMTEPEKEIIKITKFLNCYSEEKMKSFMHQYEKHKIACLNYKSLPKHMAVNTSGELNKIEELLQKSTIDDIINFYKDIK